jgi:triphosphoribosyl-dephospho-CoA synthase
LQRNEVGDLVARCATLAALLEVSAYPKPGNVHRLRDIPGTSFEHFLAGSVSMGPAIRRLALGGYDVRRGSASWKDIEVGIRILEATRDTLQWQRGGNVNLGVVLLFAPLAAAGGSALYGEGCVDVKELREALKMVTHSTTPDDAVAVYEAISLAVPPKVLGKVEEFDVLDEASVESIREEGLTLLEIFRRCAPRDSICLEWVTDYETTFTIAYPYLKEAVEASGDINSAVVDIFTLLLSKRPDSLIRRKSGLEKALEVSERACKILAEGGASSERGREMLWALDRELHDAGGRLNPGTTADLTAASIFVLLLEGWRP